MVVEGVVFGDRRVDRCCGFLHDRLVRHGPRGISVRQPVFLVEARWVIEQLFRTIKSKGFDIERVSMETAPFGTLCAMTLVAGVACRQMVQDRDGARPLLDVFENEDRPVLEAVSATLEGNTEKQKNPHPKGALAFAAWVCARLGGWTGYYGKPGPVVIRHGLYPFRAIQHGYQIKTNV